MVYTIKRSFSNVLLFRAQRWVIVEIRFGDTKAEFLESRCPSGIDEQTKEPTIEYPLFYFVIIRVIPLVSADPKIEEQCSCVDEVDDIDDSSLYPGYDRIFCLRANAEGKFLP